MKLSMPYLTPIFGLAMIMFPAAANAAQCRDSGTGKFAKCGAPGAVPASQYVAKGKPATKTAHAPTTVSAPNSAPAMKAPTATPTKAGFFASMKPKPKATATPMAMPAKTARCKTATGKFVKCGTPGAKPA